MYDQRNELQHFHFSIIATQNVGQYVSCPVLSFSSYLSSETYCRKYENLPNIVIHACKNMTEKMNLLKMSGPQIRLCLFTFRPIASKQLDSLLTIDTLS